MVICSNNVSILQWFYFYSVQVTAIDPDKSFSLSKTVEITGHVRSPIHVHVLYFQRYRNQEGFKQQIDLKGHSRSLLLVPFDDAISRLDYDFLLVVSL